MTEALGREKGAAVKRVVVFVVLLTCLLYGLAVWVGCAPRAQPPGTLSTPSKPETATPELTTATTTVTPSATSNAATDTAPSTTTTPAPAPTTLTFAIIGDYGVDDWSERAVAKLIASKKPGFILTTGDNYYEEAGGSGTAKYDRTVGAYYGGWMKDITTSGSRCPKGGAAVNSFFPAMGNHDYLDAVPAPRTYLNYFSLPGSDFANTSGNERYYEFVQGPIHFYVLNSNPQEEAGTSPSSMQGQWLRQQLAASTSPWNIVYFHHPPYSSDSFHGPTARMQWPFAAWGADAVVAGHVHTYERISRDGIVYFVNGAGGERPLHGFAKPVPGSTVRYNAGMGAQIVTATAATLQFDFVTTDGRIIDTFQLTTTGSAAP